MVPADLPLIYIHTFQKFKKNSPPARHRPTTTTLPGMTTVKAISIGAACAVLYILLLLRTRQQQLPQIDLVSYLKLKPPPPLQDPYLIYPQVRPVQSTFTPHQPRPPSFFCSNNPHINHGINDHLCLQWEKEKQKEQQKQKQKQKEKEKELNKKKKRNSNPPFQLEYSGFVNLPQGLQDGNGWYVDDYLVATTGFCGGSMFNLMYGFLQSLAIYKPFCCQRRGFIEETWYLDLKHPARGWQVMQGDSAFPGRLRQGMSCVGYQNGLFCWGGWSYTAIGYNATPTQLARPKDNPVGHLDGFRLTYQRSHLNSTARLPKWIWSKLPHLPLPIPASSGICVDEKNGFIYFVGGANYDGDQFHTEDIWTSTQYGGAEEDSNQDILDKNGKPIERKETCANCLLRYSIMDQTFLIIEKNIPMFTPRFNAAVSFNAVDQHIYVFGGITGGRSTTSGNVGYHPIVDNWKYNTVNNQWSRLKDVPVSQAMNIGMRSNIIIHNRYILLVGAGYSKGIPEKGRTSSKLKSKASILLKNAVEDEVCPNPSVSLDETTQILNVTYFKQHAKQIINYEGMRQSNLVLLYDTRKDRFWTLNGLPMDNNGMMVVMDDSKLRRRQYYQKHTNLSSLSSTVDVDVDEDEEVVLYGWGGEGTVGCYEGKAYGVHTGLTMKMKIVWDKMKEREKEGD